MIERFSILFKEIERDIGTRDMNILILRAFIDAIKYYKGKTVDSLYNQMKELVQIVNSTEPKYAIIIENFYRVFDQIHHCFLKAEVKHKHSYSGYKNCIIHSISNLISVANHEKLNLLKQVDKLNIDGKTILIHDHSHTVQDVLWHLKKQKQHFKVIVAEQDMEKTLSNIELLTERKIKFQVTPSYMLSNIEDEIDICFFGCVTLKSTFDFVVDTGTNAIISQFHLQKKPIYMFLTTSKFALWEAKKKAAVIRHQHTRKHPSKKLEFERFKFSHDRVPMNSVDYVITEEGILKPKQAESLYRKKFSEHQQITEKFSKL